MKRIPSRFRRLDGTLADLPLEEPMLLTELDGFLTGISVCPVPIPSAEWMQPIWGSDESGVAPFDDPLDVQWFADAVMARYNEIARDLRRGKPQPIFDVDERNGEIVWEAWIDGFAEAIALRPESWTALIDGDDRDIADAASRLSTLIAVARDDSALDSVQINALQDRAAADIGDSVRRLHTALPGECEDRAAVPGVLPSKPGRNEPCRCGSGKKSKRCCGVS